MFRAITEKNVLVLLRGDPLIVNEVVLSTVVVWLVRIAPDTLIVGSNPGRPNFFLFHFSLFTCQRNAHKDKTCKFMLSLKM